MNPRKATTIPLVQYILFTILVVITPFVVVTRFLQGAVYTFSRMSFTVFGFSVPYIALMMIVLFAGFLIWQRRNITLRRVIGSLIVAAMVGFGQWIQDLYLSLSPFDLQRNWHYAAYAAYVFMFFRAFHIRGVPKHTMILVAFLSAVGLSTFDELFQFHLSHRTFDVSDIAKDAWGTMIGLILVLFVSETYGTIDLRRQSIRHKTIRSYLRDPLSVLVLTGLFSLTVMVISPLLTEYNYIGVSIALSLGVFFIAVTGIHLSQFRLFRFGLPCLAGLIVIALTVSILLHRNTYINYATPRLTVYKGIPIPFFDVLIYTDGMARPVDKKHLFYAQDQKFFLGKKPDILLVGSGFQGEGGKGFNVEEGTTFIYNRNTQDGTQVIILKTPAACRAFNRLKRAGKNVLFVIHT